MRVAACTSGTLTTPLECHNADTGHDTPPHHDMYMYCYPLMWKVTLEYTTSPNLMSWVRPDQEILPDLPHTPANAQVMRLWCCYGGSQKFGRKRTALAVLNLGPVECESITLYARPQLLLFSSLGYQFYYIVLSMSVLMNNSLFVQGHLKRNLAP